MNTERAFCYECHKAKALCVCARVRRVDNRTSVLVVQHPRERLHHIGTARFAKLGLSRVRVEVAWNAGEREDRAPEWLPKDAALLYPAPGARDLSGIDERTRPRHLVVIDGTWHTARTLYRDKAWLRALPQVRLSPSSPSRYRIRREPAHDFVSTIEAIVEALRILEPETRGLDDLLAAFDDMIDAQLEYIRRGSAAPRDRDRRPREWRGTPRALVEDFAHLVVAYAESSRPDPRGRRSIVHFAAVALATGATFERLLRPPEGLPSATHLTHMDLGANDFEDAVDRAAFRTDFRDFLAASSERPLVAAWNQSTLDLLAGETSAPASRISLKGAYRTTRGGGSGSLDEVIANEGWPVAPLAFRGRAGGRLAQAAAVAGNLNKLALRS